MGKMLDKLCKHMYLCSLNTDHWRNKIRLSVVLMVPLAAQRSSRTIPQPMGPVLHHYQALPSQEQNPAFAQAVLKVPDSPIPQPAKPPPKGNPPLQHIHSSPTLVPFPDLPWPCHPLIQLKKNLKLPCSRIAPQGRHCLPAIVGTQTP